MQCQHSSSRRTNETELTGGIRWTPFTTLEDLDFADELALLSHTHQDMQEKKISSKSLCSADWSEDQPEENRANDTEYCKHYADTNI